MEDIPNIQCNNPASRYDVQGDLAVSSNTIFVPPRSLALATAASLAGDQPEMQIIVFSTSSPFPPHQ